MQRLAKTIAAVISVAVLPAAIAVSLLSAPPAFAEEDAETILYSGVWTKKSFNSAGAWAIVERGGDRYVQLSDDFKTKGAPDLKIFLSPLTASNATGKNATDGSLLVAPLKSKSGYQEYSLPAEIDLAEFQSILIHCEQYSKLWSAADL